MSTDTAEPQKLARHERGLTRREVIPWLFESAMVLLGILGDVLKRWASKAMPQHTVYEVVPGEIVVNTVTVLHDLFNIKAFEVDLRSKYPSDPIYAAGDDTLEIYLSGDENTLRTDLDHPTFTILRFKLPHTIVTSEWTVMVDARRYTARIFLYRMNSASWLRQTWWKLTKRTPLMWDRKVDAPEWAPEPTAVEIAAASMAVAEMTAEAAVQEASGVGWPGVDTVAVEVTAPEDANPPVIDGEAVAVAVVSDETVDTDPAEGLPETADRD